MSLELPTIVRECKDAALRNRAIALFGNPDASLEERDEAVRDIVNASKDKRDQDKLQNNKDRETQWRAWFAKQGFS